MRPSWITCRSIRECLGQLTGPTTSWFALLDRWGAPGRPIWEITEYEQARGLRPPGVRPGGTFTVGASKTVRVPVERLYDAFVDPEERERWLPGAAMRERTSRPLRSACFDWADDGIRVSVIFEAAGDAKSRLAIEHERLPDQETAQKTRAFWSERLTALKAELEDHRE